MASDFYEEDEPIEDVLAAWERGPHGVTAPPVQTWIDDLTGTTLSGRIVDAPIFCGRPMRLVVVRRYAV